MTAKPWFLAWCTGLWLLFAPQPGTSVSANPPGRGPDTELRRPQFLDAFPIPPPAIAVHPRERADLAFAEWNVPYGARVLIVAPHPDDEALAAGGLLQRVLERRGSARVVFLTNGDGYPEAAAIQTKTPSPSPEDFRRYGRQRRAEAEEALLTLGLPPNWLIFLGFPDGGIDDLWGPYWSSHTPFVSPYTGLSEAADEAPADSLPDSEYVGRDLAERLEEVLLGWQPTIVVTPDPRDRHLDHCTAGVFVLEAVRRTAMKRRVPLPTVLGYLVHFPDYPGSPTWVGQARRSGVCGGPDAAEVLANSEWWHLDLEEDELAGKALALSRYASQIRVMRGFLGQFVRPMEWFSHLNEAQVRTIPVQHAVRARRSLP